MALAVDDVHDEGLKARLLTMVAGAGREDLCALPLESLFTLAQQVMGELKDRVVSPGFVETLAAVNLESPSGADESGMTLPKVQSEIRQLSRVLEGVQTAVVGHTDRAFNDPRDRHRLLGLPVGKSGFRSTADFLEQTQQTPQRDTRDRVSRAAQHLAPPPSADGGVQVGSELPEVSNALWDGSVDPSVVDMITRALNEARRDAARAGARRDLVEDLIAAGQTRLMVTARHVSPSAVKIACRKWRLEFDRAMERSGAEQTASQAHLGRNAKFIGEENGLYLWHLRLTQGQHEVMKTVTSAGSNPRARKNRVETSEGNASGGPADQGLFDLVGAEALDADCDGEGFFTAAPPERWEDRQRREVDALIAALQAALTLKDRGVLPDAGGARPQVLVTIDFETLAGRLAAHPDLPPPPDIPDRLADQHPPGETRGPVISHGAFTGPIDPRILRMWACDADLIPVVLGGEGEVLDIGRAQRPFPPAIRKAIIARDRGCAAPGCDFPPSWCEVHHIRFWKEHSGPTSVDNGVLLCSHHHHALHFDQLAIHLKNGVPWFEDISPTGRMQNRDGAEPVLQRNPLWHD